MDGISGLTGRSLLVVGHSHVMALRTAAIERRERDPDRPRTRTIHMLDPAFGQELATRRVEDGFSDLLAAAIRDQINRHDPLVASAIGGAAHATIGLLQPGLRLDFVLSDGADVADDVERLPIDRDAELITEGEARDRLLEAMQDELGRLRCLRALVGPFHHLQPPPPVRSEAWVFDRAECFFRDQPRFSLAAIAPAGVRYRLWLLASRILAAECARLDCGFVVVPRRLRGAAGLLRPSHGRDATHGNTHFGEAILQELDRLAIA